MSDEDLAARRAIADETLENLLQPGMSTETFLNEYWEKKPAFISRNKPDDFKDIFTVEDVSCAVEFASGSNVIYFKDRQLNHEYENIHLAFLHDVSIVINHLDKSWPDVMHYCHRLAPIFGHMYANMYLTPAGNQTAPPHTDDRDVIIVQVFGHKHWKLWNNPQPLCYKEEQLGKGQPKLLAEDLGEPMISETLEQGDVLYMPRGYLHEATTSDTTSLHITFAVPTADFAMGHFISEMIDGLARKVPSLRNSIAPGLLGCVPGDRAGASAASQEQCEEQFKTAVQTILENLDFDRAKKVFAGKMHYHNGQQHEAATNISQLVGQQGVSHLRLNTRVRKTEGIKVKKQGDDVVFAMSNGASARISSPPKVFVETLKKLGKVGVDRNGTFAIEDLPVDDPFTKLCVAEVFEQMRLFEVAREAPVSLLPVQDLFPATYDTDVFDLKLYTNSDMSQI